MATRARRNRERRRWWRRILLAIVVLPLGLAVSTAVWLLSSLPQTTGHIALDGPSAEIRITRDAAGVPHITAATERDAAFALGFVHAQDRLFQMELTRRLAAGRLSEIIGPATLGSDRFMRTLGLYRLAEAQYSLLSPALRAGLDAYAAGVNAYLSQRRALPLEFYLLTMRSPEPWRPADTLVWGKLMDLVLAGNYRAELQHARLIAQLGPEHRDEIDQLFPAYPGDGPVTLGPLADLFHHLPLHQFAAAVPDWIGPDFNSNNWVVDGAHSASGKPLLANDPHLGLSTPDIWYLARIDTPELHLAGASAPGAPFIIIGHNQRIGWGFTNTESDVEDTFIEKLDPDNPDRYLTPQGSEAFTVRREEIRVRGADPVTLTIRSTRHGPVVSDLKGIAELPSGHVLALQATFLVDDDRSPQAFWDINHALDWPSFNAAFRDYIGPQQNIVYADVDGTIAFTAPARVPIRGAGDGWVPAEGWSGTYDWTGFIPFEDLPRRVNPPDGRFVSANNKIVADDYPYYLGRGWDSPNRARRINNLLDETPLETPDAFAEIQADTVSLAAKDLLPLMLAAKPFDERTAEALDRLRGWDGRMDRDKVEPLLFTAWLLQLNHGLFEDRLGPSFADYSGLHPLAVANILRDHRAWCSFAARPDAPDNCDIRLAEALGRALDQLATSYGPDMAEWRWGRAHVATFEHQVLARIPVLSRLTANEIPASGGDDTLNRGGMSLGNPDHPFRDVHGSGLRMILDFSDLDASRFMIAPGQSGNPLSAHYGDLLRRWRDFDWLRLGPDDAHGDTLLLVPR